MNCDRIASWYRWLEYAAFGGALRRRREAFLFELGDPQKVLALGDGDGRFLQAFAALYPRAQIEVVDVSARMIELAQARVPRAAFHLADAREFEYLEKYDLAVGHFFFDCFETDELEALLSRIHTNAWLVSEFRRTAWSWPILRGLYLLFRVSTGLRVTSLPDHRVLLSSLGYHMANEQRALCGLLVSELWAIDCDTLAKK